MRSEGYFFTMHETRARYTLYLFPLLAHNTPHARVQAAQLYGKPLKMRRGIGKGEDRIKGDAEIAMKMQSFAVGQI